MAKKIFNWASLLLLSFVLSGCYLNQRILPHIIPKTQHEKYLDQIKFLRDHGVQVVILGDTVRMLLPADFFFYDDSAEFRRDRAYVMWDIALVLNNCGNAPIKVYGFTDDIGTHPHKFKRSYDWAFTVASYLWESGVSWDRMTVRGYGDRHDIASNRKVSGSHFNRRVEIIMD